MLMCIPQSFVAFARSPTYEQSIDPKITESIRCQWFCWSDFRCQRRCKSIQSTPEQIWIIHVHNMKSKNLFLCTQCTSNCLTRRDAHFVYKDHSFTFFIPLVLFSSFSLSALSLLCFFFCFYSIAVAAAATVLKFQSLPLDIMCSDWTILNLNHSCWCGSIY